MREKKYKIKKKKNGTVGLQTVKTEGEREHISFEDALRIEKYRAIIDKGEIYVRERHV